MSMGDDDTVCLGKNDVSSHTQESVQLEDKTSNVERETDKARFEKTDHQKKRRLRSLVEEPPELELKTLPEHLEYVVLVE